MRVVIDARGFFYTLNGDDTLVKLGYDDAKAPIVPDAWRSCSSEGVPLSTAAALCPPTPTGPVKGCSEPPG